MAGKPFVMINVWADDKEDLRKIIKKEKLTWVSWLNGKVPNALDDSWGVVGWPTIFVIDAQGIIRHADIDADKLDKAVDTLVAEVPAP